MAKKFLFAGTLKEISDKLDELNTAGKNAAILFGPFLVASSKKISTGVYEVFISQFKD